MLAVNDCKMALVHSDSDNNTDSTAHLGQYTRNNKKMSIIQRILRGGGEESGGEIRRRRERGERGGKKRGSCSGGTGVWDISQLDVVLCFLMFGHFKRNSNNRNDNRNDDGIRRSPNKQHHRYCSDDYKQQYIDVSLAS